MIYQIYIYISIIICTQTLVLSMVVMMYLAVDISMLYLAVYPLVLRYKLA